MQRALLIRSSFGELPGGRNALDCMGSLLRAYGFEIRECDGPAATRDNIVGALNQLIADTAEDDAAVVFYSGHGRRANNTRFVPGGPVPASVEHLCPTDYGNSTEARFLGISAGELSVMFSRMRSENVTALFDSCFTGQLGRGDEPVVVWPQMTYAMLLGYYSALRKAEPAFDALTLAGNTNLVRVAASADISFVGTLPPREALEALGIECARTDEFIGEMTSALVQILAPLRGRRVSWKQIVTELRARLPLQPAVLGGPAQRVPFSLEVVDATTFRVSLEGEGAALDAGLLLGVSPGDVYAIVPAGETDPRRALARVTIATATATAATGPIEWLSATRELPGTCVAIALQRIAPRHPVRIEAPPELVPAISAAIEKSPLLRVADVRDADAVATIRVSGDSIVLGDGIGPLHPPAPYPTNLTNAVLDATNLATVRRLRAFAGELDASKLDIELGAVRSGAFVRLGDRAVVAPSEDLAVRFTNRGDETRYVNLFDIGLRCKITLLEGEVAIAPDKSLVAGIVSGTGRLEGYELEWPAGLARDRARLESLLVVVTRRPVDLSLLATNEYLPTTRAADSPLQQQFAQAVSGQTRGGDPEPFATRWLDFTLLPFAGTTEIGAPVTDESAPDLQLFSRAGTPAVLRIEQRSPDVRVDVLVCTADHFVASSPSAVGEVWRGGPAAEIFVWTSTSGDARPLDTLLQISREITAALGVRHLAAGASLVIAGAARAAIAAIARDVTLVYRGFVQSAPAPAHQFTTPQIAFSIGEGD